MQIPQRPLGTTGVSVSALGFGGYHIAMAGSEREGIRIDGLRYGMSLPVTTTVSGIDSMKSAAAKPESGRRVQADVRTADEHAASARP